MQNQFKNIRCNKVSVNFTIYKQMSRKSYNGFVNTYKLILYSQLQFCLCISICAHSKYTNCVHIHTHIYIYIYPYMCIYI